MGSLSAPPPAVEPLVANHIRTGLTQLVDGDHGSLIQNIGGSVTESTWTSVGPTGSGADLETTDLDLAPLSATSIRLNVRIGITGTTASFNSELRVRHTDATSAGGSYVGNIAYCSSDAGDAECENTVDVLVDENNCFDVMWISGGGSGGTPKIWIIYKGFTV